MNILISGGHGFIGSHLADELRPQHQVVQVDRGDHDLRLAEECLTVMRHHQPDIVIHLAAKVGRLFGEDNPAETIEDNITMTAHVAQAASAVGAQLVYASTSEIYGDNGDELCDELEGPFSEPHNLYGLTKKWGEQLCRHYCPQDLVILRLSMPYGPGLPPGRGRAAIVNMLYQADNRLPIPVHRGAERSWCWIGDTVRGIRMILEQTTGGVFNVGRDDASVPMLEVARIACDLTGAPYHLIQTVEPPARQTVVKRLSTRRLRALGWQPQVELVEGMERTLRWVREREPAAVEA